MCGTYSAREAETGGSLGLPHKPTDWLLWQVPGQLRALVSQQKQNQEKKENEHLPRNDN